jgi:3-hydroxyacyl-[acyl-carrier-protein] dehydratase
MNKIAKMHGEARVDGQLAAQGEMMFSIFD